MRDRKGRDRKGLGSNLWKVERDIGTLLANMVWLTSCSFFFQDFRRIQALLRTLWTKGTVFLLLSALFLGTLP